MSPKRALGWIILALLAAGDIALFIVGGIDGLKHGFTLGQFFLRFFTIGAGIKAFDILALDGFWPVQQTCAQVSIDQILFFHGMRREVIII